MTTGDPHALPAMRSRQNVPPVSSPPPRTGRPRVPPAPVDRGVETDTQRGAAMGGDHGLTSASAFRSCVRRVPSSFTTFLAPSATAASMRSRCLSSSASSSGPGRRRSAPRPRPARPCPPASQSLTWFRGPTGFQAANLHSQQGHLQLAVPQHLLGSCQELPLLWGRATCPSDRG